MDCPRCDVELELLDADSLQIDEKYEATWHYFCPKCRHKYAYTEVYKLAYTDWDLEDDE